MAVETLAELEAYLRRKGPGRRTQSLWSACVRALENGHGRKGTEALVRIAVNELHLPRDRALRALGQAEIKARWLS